MHIDFLDAVVSHMANYCVELDLTFHALADPTRRAVIQRLCRGPATVSELAEPFDITLPSFMKHVGVLEGIGLIRSKKSGRVRTCTLDHKQLAAAERWFGKQRAIWKSRYENLDNLLETLDSSVLASPAQSAGSKNTHVNPGTNRAGRLGGLRSGLSNGSGRSPDVRVVGPRIG